MGSWKFIIIQSFLLVCWIILNIVQSMVDRQNAEDDYHINVKAEKEMAMLHEKIDALKEIEIKKLIDIIQDLEKALLKKPN